MAYRNLKPQINTVTISDKNVIGDYRQLNGFMMGLLNIQKKSEEYNKLLNVLEKKFKETPLDESEESVLKSFDGSFHVSIPPQLKPGPNIINTYVYQQAPTILYGGQVLIYNRGSKNYIRYFKVNEGVIQGGKQNEKQKVRRSKSQEKPSKRAKSSNKQVKRSKSKK